VRIVDTDHAPVPETLKRINMRRFLEELRSSGPLTRADLTRITGVSAATSSKIIIHLEKLGLIEELESVSVTNGRPGKLFQLSSARSYIVGVAVDVHLTRICRAGVDGKVPTTTAMPTPATYDALIQELASRIKYEFPLSTGKCLGVTVSLPGLVDAEKGQSIHSRNLPILNGRSVANDLSAEIGVPAYCVQENRGMATAEQLYGQARDLRDFIVIDVSEGIGSAAVLGGVQVTGFRGFAGEIGNSVFQTPESGPDSFKSLEELASERSVVDAICRHLNQHLSFEEIERRVKNDALDVRDFVCPAAFYLAQSTASMIMQFDPEAVFVSGRMFDLSPRAFDYFKSRVEELVLPANLEGLQILPTKVDKLQGAVASGLERVFSEVGPKLV